MQIDLQTAGFIFGAIGAASIIFGAILAQFAKWVDGLHRESTRHIDIHRGELNDHEHRIGQVEVGIAELKQAEKDRKK